MTHLPQIAAYADAHVRIAKGERDGRTVTEVRALDGEDADRGGRRSCSAGRGGGPGAAVAGAREMLERAAAWRAAGG